MYPYDDIVGGRLRIGQLRERQASDTGLAI
jgi:hypothetical protein